MKVNKRGIEMGGFVENDVQGYGANVVECRTHE